MKLNFIHTVSLAAWLKCSHGSIQLSTNSTASPFHSAPHWHWIFLLCLSCGNIPALFKPPHPPPTYLPITEGSSWTCALSNPSSALHSCGLSGTAPNTIISQFTLHTQETNILPQRVTAGLNKMPRNGWQAAFRKVLRCNYLSSGQWGFSKVWARRRPRDSPRQVRERTGARCGVHGLLQQHIFLHQF